MWFTRTERITLTVLGAALLAGWGVLWRWQQRPPLQVEEAAAPAAWDARLAEARQVDVNTADVAELERLPGVGPALAERLVADRLRRGPFASPEDLRRVPGIGEALAGRLREHVTAGPKEQP